MIVREVTNYGGDILKFAGDAIFAEWPVGKNVDAIHSRTFQTLSEAVTIAAVCGARIASACGNVPIYTPAKGLNEDIGIKSIIGTLNVHCGLGAGKVATVHVGNDTARREFLLVGNPIEQVSHEYHTIRLRYFFPTSLLNRKVWKIFNFLGNGSLCLRWSWRSCSLA
jgi:class 3 adenylate cyclase